MSIFRKIELTIIALMVLGLAGLSLYSLHLKGERDEAKQQNSLSTARADAHGTALREYTRVITDKETADAQLEDALAANPEYAGAPVPPAVADLLRHPSGAARAVPR